MDMIAQLALDLVRELTEDSAPTTSPRNVAERLRQFVDLPYRLRWDDRLGSLAIAAGLESALLSPLPITIASVLARYQWSAAWTMSLAVTAGLSLPIWRESYRAAEAQANAQLTATRFERANLINVQRSGSKAKPYQVRQVRAVITRHGLGGPE